MTDLFFMTSDEICKELGSRLKAIRIQAKLTQKELSERAGVALSVVKAVESIGNCSLNNWIKIVYALNKVDELEKIFEVRPTSIDQVISSVDESKKPQRVKHKKETA